MRLAVNRIKVSIIIPVYNGGMCLDRCLDSVIRQTVKEKEIICINDGSTDATADILKRYEKEVTVITQENQGAGVARNVGMKIAKGEFIAFMDGDDYYAQDDVLEYLYAKAITYDVDICGGNIQRVNQDGIVRQRKADKVFDECKIINYTDFQTAFGYTRYIYRRKKLTDHAICFPAYRRFQDPPFFVEAMTAAGKFLAVPVTVYCYRCHYEKREIFNEKQSQDILKGVDDVLKLSVNCHYEKLYKEMLEILMRIVNGSIPFFRFFNEHQDQIMNCYGNILKIIEGKMKDNSRTAEKLIKLGDEKYLKKKFMEIEKEKEQLKQIVKEQKSVYIYGAGFYGSRMYDYIRKYAAVQGFVVTDKEENPSVKEGLHVFDLTEISTKKDGLIIVTVVDKRMQTEIIRKLEESKWKKYMAVKYDAFINYCGLD